VEITFDLETTALDANAAVMQIAAVAWERGGDKFVVMEKFNKRIDLAELFLRGFTFNGSTQKFWKDQSADVKNAVLKVEQASLADVVNDFSMWVQDIKESCGEDICIWAQGSDFDMPKLQHLYAELGVKMPWKYTQVRCARTLALEMQALLGIDNIYSRYSSITDGMTHDAMFDAMRTAQTTWNILNELGNLQSQL